MMGSVARERLVGCMWRLGGAGTPSSGHWVGLGLRTSTSALSAVGRLSLTPLAMGGGHKPQGQKDKREFLLSLTRAEAAVMGSCFTTRRRLPAPQAFFGPFSSTFLDF